MHHKTRILQNVLGSTLCVAVFVVSSFFPLPTASLHAADDSQEDLGDLQDDFEKLEEKKEKYENLIDLKNRESTEINKQISQINSENATVESGIKKNEEEIEKIADDSQNLTEKIGKQEIVVTDQQKLLAHLLRSHYEQTSGSVAHSVFLTQDGGEFFNTRDRTAQTGQKMRELVHNTIAIKEQLEKDRQTLEQKKVEKVDATYQLEKRTQYLDTQRSLKQTLANEIESEKNKYGKRLSKIEKEQLDIQKEIQDIELEHIGDFSSADLPSPSAAGFSRPVKKPYIVTQGYGKTSYSHHYKGGSHNGVDYAARGSKDIIAASDGKVIATGNMGRYGYGKWVAIDHDNGLVSMYGHLSSVKASRGDKVDRGDKIGVMGTTGFSTGVHLHFTLFVEKTFDVVKSKTVSSIKIPTGATVNPANYL